MTDWSALVGHGLVPFPRKLRRITQAELLAAQSPKGGYSKATLAKWGIPWPPPKGWKQDLIEGRRLI